MTPGHAVLVGLAPGVIAEGRVSGARTKLRRPLLAAGGSFGYPSSMTRQLTLEYEDDLLFAIGMSPAEFSKQAAFLLAAKLYELGRLSSGQAAKLCGKDRVGFLLALRTVGMNVSNLRAEDAEDELAFAARG